MEQILKILQELKPEIDFVSCTTLIDDALLDSFDIISIVAELNAAFDIRIPASDVTPENFNSARSLHLMVQNLLD